MKYTIFETPGEFDLSSIDTFGMNAKPNTDNPIGYFGTGLKIAIAVLLREGAKIDLYCNGNHYTFFTKEKEFRGKTFDQCYYKRENGFLKVFTTEELPYTTELGKNWELWMAFRELYSNTLDENGTVYNDFLADLDVKLPDFTQKRDKTFIVVEHLEFAKLVDTRNEIFLDPKRDVLVDELRGNITSGKTPHVYYRGMRALDLPKDKPAMFTYNIIQEQELTEDRTLKSTYHMKDVIQDLVSNDLKDKQLIKQILTAPDDTFEKDLDFKYAFSASPEFKEVVTELRDHKALNRSARVYYSSHISPPVAPKIPDNIWDWILEALEVANADIEDEGTHLTYLEAFRAKMNR